jgi:multiple sugar transport system permease protein
MGSPSETAEAEPGTLSEPGTEPGGRAPSRLRSARVYLYLLPAAVLLVAIFAVPLAESVILSLQKSAGLAGTSGWAGFANFTRELKNGLFWQVAWQTVIWTVAVVGLTTIISIVLASLLREPFRGRGVVRSLLMIPWASSIAVSAIVWQFGLVPGGLIDRSLTLVGLKSAILPWLANTPQAFVVLIFVGVWVSVPFTMLIILAGMNGIPKDVYDAASLESPSRIRLEWSITLPMLRHVILISLMSNFVVVFNSFPIIYVMTQGGPVNKTNILATYLYEKAFTDLDFGDSSAIAVVVSLALLVATFIYVRMLVHRPSRYERQAHVG